MIYKLDDHKVTTDGDDFYVAETATVVGRVTLKKAVSYTHLTLPTKA